MPCFENYITPRLQFEKTLTSFIIFTSVVNQFGKVL